MNNLENLYNMAAKAQALYKAALDYRNLERKDKVITEYNDILEDYWKGYKEEVSRGILKSDKFTNDKLMYFIMTQALSDPQLLADFAWYAGLTVNWSKPETR